jgi:hypothetical protein
MEMTGAVDEAMLSLLSRRRARAAQVGQMLSGMRPKVDMSTNLEEMLARGQISEDKYKELKRAGQAREKDVKIDEWVDKKSGKKIVKMQRPDNTFYTTEGTEVMPTAGQMGRMDEKIFTDPFDFDDAGNVTGVKLNVNRAMRVKLRNQLENEAIALMRSQVSAQQANQMAELMGQTPDNTALEFIKTTMGGIKQRINALSGKTLRTTVEPFTGGPKSRKEVEKSHEEALVRRTPIPAPTEAKTTKSGARFTFKPKK